MTSKICPLCGWVSGSFSKHACRTPIFTLPPLNRKAYLEAEAAIEKAKQNRTTNDSR